MAHGETHRSDRGGWLRALVLGANDGIVSIASLVLGMAGAEAGAGVLVGGLAGLVGGALSMAVGEYVSVSSQADAEAADLHKERRELETEPERELDELVGIWTGRGLPRALAVQVAEAMHAHDALGAHLRDELGITELSRARPLVAAGASAAAFAVGGAIPVLVAALAPADVSSALVAASSLVALTGLGALSARLGGARVARATLRVVVGGAAAMAVTFGIGALVGVAV